jgi:four helix bundle protein
MEKPVNDKKFDLRDRTLRFAQEIRKFLRTTEVTLHNSDDIKQLIRSSGSIGANYIEAEDAISAKDFLHRIKIARKEAKETTYWLRLLGSNNRSSQYSLDTLIDESSQLMRIFGKIVSDIELKSRR